MRRKFVIAAALLYSAAHVAMTGVRQPLANFYGDFLASFPAWTMAALFGRLDFYNGSLAQQWASPPIWHYGPVEHLITIPLFAFASLRQAYVAWLVVSYLFVIVAAVIAARIIDDALVVILVFCNFNPLYEALTQRTIELFELMLLFAAYALYRRGRDTASAGAATPTTSNSASWPRRWSSCRRTTRTTTSFFCCCRTFFYMRVIGQVGRGEPRCWRSRLSSSRYRFPSPSCSASPASMPSASTCAPQFLSLERLCSWSSSSRNSACRVHFPPPSRNVPRRNLRESQRFPEQPRCGR